MCFNGINELKIKKAFSNPVKMYIMYSYLFSLKLDVWALCFLLDTF